MILTFTCGAGGKSLKGGDKRDNEKDYETY